MNGVVLIPRLRNALYQLNKELPEEAIRQVLEGTNIKLSSVTTDISGVSGRSMLEAMINGINDPSKLADMAK